MSEWKYWTPERDGHAPDDWVEGLEIDFEAFGNWYSISRVNWKAGTKYRYRPLQDATYEPDLLAQCLALPQDQREALIEAMQKPTLLPCPFCGSKNVTDSWTRVDAETQWWGGQCNDCGAQTCPYNSKDEAIAAWNRRAP